MLRRCTIEEMNLGTFKHGFFITHFLSVTARKNQKKFFEKRSKFFANQTNLFSFIESCCCFWFVSSQGQWEFKKTTRIYYFMIFCPSNAHNSNAQSFPENKYSFTALLSLCIVWESNPCQQIGNLLCYHYTNDAEKVYDRRDEFQTFKFGFFLTNILSVTSKRNQNYSLRSGVAFSLIRLI